jgi:hypothetical protein
MGKPMELPEGLFPRTASSYMEAYAELEQDPLIECFESDACSDGEGYSSARPLREALICCDNPRCNRGGYLMEQEIRNMVFARVEHSEFIMHCPGDEGSPKGRRKGNPCDKRLHVRLTLKYKNQPGQEGI